MSNDWSLLRVLSLTAVVLVAIAVVGPFAVTSAAAVSVDSDIQEAVASDLVVDRDDAEQAFRIEIDGTVTADETLTINSSNPDLQALYNDSNDFDLEASVRGPDADTLSVTATPADDALVDLTLSPDAGSSTTVNADIIVAAERLDTDAAAVRPGNLNRGGTDLVIENATGDDTLFENSDAFVAVHTDNAAQLDATDEFPEGKPLTITPNSSLVAAATNDTVADTDFINQTTVAVRSVEVEDGDRVFGPRALTVTVREINGSAYAGIDTARLDPNTEYVVEVEGNGTEGTVITNASNWIVFETVDQDLGATWDDDSVSDIAEDVELDLDPTGRGLTDYNVEISADGLDYDDLADLFANTAINDYPQAQPQGDQPRFAQRADADTITIQAADELTANVSNANIDPGTYTFDIAVTDADAETTATLTIGAQEASFDQELYTRSAGELAEITVSLDAADEVWMQFGDEDAGFVDILYLEDDDGDDEVTVTVNTRLVGTNHSRIDGVDESDTEVVYYAEDDIVDSYIHDVGINNDDASPVTEAAFYADDELTDQYTGGAPDEFEQYLEELQLINDGETISEQLVRPLQPVNYDLVIDRRGRFIAEDQTSAVDEEIAAAELDLVQPSARSVDIATAPVADADADEPDTLPDELTPRERIAIGDRAVVTLQADGLTGALAAIDYRVNDNSIDTGIDDGYRLNVLEQLAVADGEFVGDGVTFEFEESGGANQNDRTLQYATALRPASTLFADQRTSEGDPTRLYLVINTDDEPIDGGLSDADRFTTELEYDASEEQFRFATTDGPFGGADGVTTEPAFPYYPGNFVRSDAASVTFEEPTVTFDRFTGEVVELAPRTDARVSGRTNVAPGTEAQIRVRVPPPEGALPEEDPSFLASNSVIIGEDGGFSTTVDLSSRIVGEEAFVELETSNRTVGIEDAVFRNLDDVDGPLFEGSLSAPTRVERGESVNLTATIRNVGTESGTGEIRVIVDGSQRVRGVFDLTPGSSEQLTESLTDIQTITNVTIETTDDRRTQTITVTEPTTNTTPTPTNTSADTDDGGFLPVPGFGILGAVVAVLLGGLLVWRRTGSVNTKREKL